MMIYIDLLYTMWVIMLQTVQSSSCIVRAVPQVTVPSIFGVRIHCHLHRGPAVHGGMVEHGTAWVSMDQHGHGRCTRLLSWEPRYHLLMQHKAFLSRIMRHFQSTRRQHLHVGIHTPWNILDVFFFLNLQPDPYICQICAGTGTCTAFTRAARGHKEHNESKISVGSDAKTVWNQQLQ